MLVCGRAAAHIEIKRIFLMNRWFHRALLIPESQRGQFILGKDDRGCRDGRRLRGCGRRLNDGRACEQFHLLLIVIIIGKKLKEFAKNVFRVAAQF